jgi:predicted nucleic acid-binding protein
VTYCVLDCSVAIGWCFADEASAAGDALLDRVQADGAVVPPLWHLEVANVLIQAERRSRLGPGGAEERLAMLDFLPIRVDADGQGAFWRRAVALLARAETLTAYDAAYLELATRRRLPLASTDRHLRAAAERHGLRALPA